MAKVSKKAGTVLETLKAKRAEYEVNKGDDGRRLIDNGDDVAVQLRGMDLDDVYSTVAKALGCTEKELRERYQHLNPGMQRMNLGNRLRGANGDAKPAKKATKTKKATKKARTKKAKAPVTTEEAPAAS